MLTWRVESPSKKAELNVRVSEQQRCSDDTDESCISRLLGRRRSTCTVLLLLLLSYERMYNGQQQQLILA